MLAFARDGVECAVNFGPLTVPLPKGELLLASDVVGDALPPNTAVWTRT